MTSNKTDSSDEQDFIAQCEEELKDRFTEKDEEFMKVSSMEPMPPPIVESWWTPRSSYRRNDRGSNRRHNFYDRRNRDNNGDNRNNGRNRGYGHGGHSRPY